MRQDRTCKYCNIEFPNSEGRVFSNHVRWCTKNTENGDKGRANLSIASDNRFDDKLGKKKNFLVNCKKCDKEFIVIERDKRHPEKDSYFCSRSCGNSHVIVEETRQHLRDLWAERTAYKNKECSLCKNIYKGNKLSKFCSKKCSSESRCKKDNGSLTYYRFQCRFKFNLKDYSDEFDFSLVKKYGWYSAKNRANNLNGVSRDHIVSVKFGYDNKIDPKVISHPANCQLLRHNDNVSKNKNSSITIEELLEKIDNWNSKYGEILVTSEVTK